MTPEAYNGTVLVESNGSQILPPVEARHATINGWQAKCAVSADARTKHPMYRDIASRLFVRSAIAHLEAVTG